MKTQTLTRWILHSASARAAWGFIAAALDGTQAHAAEKKKRSGPPPIVYTEFPNQCARCHKPDGRGGPAYGGFAADLRASELDKDGFIYFITEGVRQRGMPEFKSTLSKREIDGIAQYIVDNIQGKYYDENGNPITAEEAAKLDPRLNSGKSE